MTASAAGGLVTRRWRSFENLAYLKQTDSSSDIAREFMELYFEEDQRLPPTVILAESQTKARGRKGDRWHAPADRGLYFTFVRPAAPGEPLSLVPIAVARWIRDAVEETTEVQAALKWPNDLYVEHRKLGRSSRRVAHTGRRDVHRRRGRIERSRIGRELGVSGATTIEEESGRPVNLTQLTQAILDRLDVELADPHWHQEVHRWEERSAHHRGDHLTIRRGDNELTGEYRGLSAEGFLRLKTLSGEAVIATGEVAKW